MKPQFFQLGKKFRVVLHHRRGRGCRGQGSRYGNKPVPTLKFVSNTPIFDHMMEDMDVNCGTIVDGTETLEKIGERIFQEMLATASGRKTKSEQLGVGDAEFVPWQTWAQM